MIPPTVEGGAKGTGKCESAGAGEGEGAGAGEAGSQVTVKEEENGVTETAAKARLEDWSDPDVKLTPEEEAERLRYPNPLKQ